MSIEEIRKKIEKLEREGEELKQLKYNGNTAKYFKRIIEKTSKYRQFD